MFKRLLLLVGILFVGQAAGVGICGNILDGIGAGVEILAVRLAETL